MRVLIAGVVGSVDFPDWEREDVVDFLHDCGLYKCMGCETFTVSGVLCPECRKRREERDAFLARGDRLMKGKKFITLPSRDGLRHQL